MTLLRSVWVYIRSAPGTYIWLSILLASTIAMHHLSPEAVRILGVVIFYGIYAAKLIGLDNWRFWWD